MSSVARKFTRNYKANFPSKKVVFTEGVKEGDPFKVKCWINELSFNKLKHKVRKNSY
jgi:hypothetical protein